LAAFISSSSCDLLFDLYFKIPNSSHLSNNLFYSYLKYPFIHFNIV
jgi:hypothetical protein